MIGAISAEWLKIRSVRSTYVTLGAVVVIMLFAAWNAWGGAGRWDSSTAAERAGMTHIPPLEQTLLPVVQLCVAVLGVLAVTPEHATGMIRATLVATPRRCVVLTAKAAIVAVTAFVVGQAVVVTIHLTTRWVLGDRPYAAYSSPVSDTVPALLALGLSAVVVALVGLGLGATMRSTAGAIVSVAALLFVLPTLTRLFPPPWNERVTSVMLPKLPRQLAGSELGGAFYTGVLSPLWALAVMAGYVVVALGAAAIVIARRDA